MSGTASIRILAEKLEESVRRRWSALGAWVDRRVGDEDVQGFKPDAVAIEEAPVPLPADVTLYLLAVLMVIAILWSIFGSVDRIVVAPGKIATRTPLLVMQPFTTSRILEINVKAGDHVRKGQILVRFDPAFAQADVAVFQRKAEAFKAQIARLEAELTGKKFSALPGDTQERITQAQIYDHEMSDYAAQMEQRDSRLAQVESQVRVDEASIPRMRSQLDMAHRIVVMQQNLRAQKAAAELDVMRAQSGEIDSELKLSNTIGDIAKLRAQRAEISQERQAFSDKWRSDRSQQLVQTRQDWAEATETLNKARRMKDLTEIVAPVDGVVLEVADRSIGSVLREAETLVTLVPDGADLYVEANVPSRDIGYIKVGDMVRVKLETYPFQRFGTVDGQLDVISADSIPLKQDNAQSQLVYRIQVRITAALSSLVRQGIHIRPGLVASAEIKSGKRSVASYIFNPILRTADESLREP